ncbi:MAG: hypothetical protein ACYTHJ_13235 [Planctomycetota bacterium]|jgi:cobalamin biosynthesis Mg chelatase CobN
MSTRNFLIVCAAGGLLLGGGAWAIFGRSGDDQGVKVPEKFSVESLKQNMENPEEMRKTMSSMRGANLTDEQRWQARRNMGRAFRASMKERVDEYFAADDSEKDAILDEHLDEWMARMEQMRAAREERRKEEGNEGNQAERREEMRRNMAQRTTQERKERSESRNPDDSARSMAYRTALRKKAAERGIEMGRGGRGGGGGGRRGP